MAKHKIIIGEWVSVYVNQTMIIDTDKTKDELENMTAEQIAKLLDYDANTRIVDTCKSDYDWTTEEHENWDRHDDCGYTYVERLKGSDNDK